MFLFNLRKSLVVIVDQIYNLSFKMVIWPLLIMDNIASHYDEKHKSGYNLMWLLLVLFLLLPFSAPVFIAAMLIDKIAGLTNVRRVING